MAWSSSSSSPSSSTPVAKRNCKLNRQGEPPSTSARSSKKHYLPAAGRRTVSREFEFWTLVHHVDDQQQQQQQQHNQHLQHHKDEPHVEGEGLGSRAQTRETQSKKRSRFANRTSRTEALRAKLICMQTTLRNSHGTIAELHVQRELASMWKEDILQNMFAMQTKLNELDGKVAISHCPIPPSSPSKTDVLARQLAACNEQVRAEQSRAAILQTRLDLMLDCTDYAHRGNKDHACELFCMQDLLVRMELRGLRVSREPCS